MITPSIANLRKDLDIVLGKEDGLLKGYKSMHDQLHIIDRELITAANDAAQEGFELSPGWLKYKQGERREASWQMMMKREKMRPVVNERKELLARILEMETQSKKAGEGKMRPLTRKTRELSAQTAKIETKTKKPGERKMRPLTRKTRGLSAQTARMEIKTKKPGERKMRPLTRKTKELSAQTTKTEAKTKKAAKASKAKGAARKGCMGQQDESSKGK